MSFKKRWFLNLEKKKKNGSYLKYEEGEVIPVESKNSYPPFLNDEEENVKHFKDMQQKEDIRRHTDSMLKKSKRMKEKFASETKTPSSNEPHDFQNKSFKPFIIIKLLWLLIIGGLIYSSIPLISYFSSQTPELPSVIERASDEKEKNKDKEDGDFSSETVEAVKSTVSKTAEKAEGVIDDISKGSGLVNATKENLTTSEKSSGPSSPVTTTFSEEQWLSYFSFTQNQKQEQLIALQNYTLAYTNGELGRSPYRLRVKGITNKTERLQSQLAETVKNNDTSAVEPVIIALGRELESLRNMSVNLSSVSERHIVQVYNEGVDEQNQLTEQYKTSFKALLDNYGKSYTEENGVIKYK